VPEGREVGPAGDLDPAVVCRGGGGCGGVFAEGKFMLGPWWTDRQGPGLGPLGHEGSSSLGRQMPKGVVQNTDVGAECGGREVEAGAGDEAVTS
jgi:hypothetical protein